MPEAPAAPPLRLRRVSPWWLRPGGAGGQVLLEAEPLPGGRTRVTLPAAGNGPASGEGPTLQAAALEAARAAGRGPAPAPEPAADGGPAWHERLGWCTWNAFYQDVDEAKVTAGLEAWERAGLVPKTLILDDGWLDVRRFSDAEQNPGVRVNLALRSFDADPAKFPGGLGPMIRRVKERFGVERVGVWHTLMGHWCGVDPESDLGRRYGVRAVTARDTGMFVLPVVPDRGAVPADRISGFFHDWHARLASQGVDFVKVDNGGSLVELCGPEEEQGFVAAYHAAVRASAAEHFGPGGLLPCMSMVPAAADAPDPGRSVFAFRNSDDFYPDKVHSHRQHVRDNAANALWTSGFARPDWDMFYSRHPWAGYHAAARAVSGGPVYVSDRVGESDPTLIRRLLDGDGRALVFDGPTEPLTLHGPFTVVRNRHERGAYAAETLGVFSAEEAAGPATACPLPPTEPGEGSAEFRTDGGAGDHPDWELVHRVAYANGLAVFGWSDALCPPVTVRAVEAVGGDALRVTLRPPATDAARLLVAVEATGEVVRVAAGAEGTLRLDGGTPAWLDA